MADSKVQFVLETPLPATLYASLGDSECVQDKKVSASFSSSQPGFGSVEARSSDSCAFKDSHTHLYLWADEAHTEKLCDTKLFEKNGTDTWAPDVEYTKEGYDLNVQKNGDNAYTFILT